MVILEVKGGNIGINVDNGALLNYNAFHRQDGRICGFVLSIDSDMNLTATAGTLMVHGFRLQVRNSSETITTKISSYEPISTDELHCVNLVLSYSDTERSSSFTFNCEPAETVHANPAIEEGITGTVYYRLATFKKKNGAVTDFTSCVKQLDTAVSDYNKLSNKPSLNGITIEGAKTEQDYGISAIDITDLDAVLDMKD